MRRDEQKGKPDRAAVHRSRYRELRAAGSMPGLSFAGAEPLLAGEGAGIALGKVLEEDDQLALLLARLVHGGKSDRRLDLRGDTDPTLLRSAALAFRLVAANRVGRCEGFPYDAFWSQSLACAVASQLLAQELGSAMHVEAFLAAFFWRIGSLALASAFPADYSEVVSGCAPESLETLRAAETSRFGIDHVQLSHALLEEFSFPARTLDMLARMCDSERPFDAERLLVVAERLAAICSLDGEARQERWADLVNERREFGIERDAFAVLGDAVLHAWWEWGEDLGVRTRPTTSFLALDQTATVDRRILALAVARERRAGDRPLSVLVVDDDPIAVRILKEQLVRYGHDVQTALDGQQALQGVLRRSPDVVVADWVMPEMDGLELCRALRRYEAGRHVFFILLTGRDEEEHLTAAFEAGVDDFLTKPTKPGVLLARMTAARRVIDLRDQHADDQRLIRQQLVRMSVFAGRVKEAASTDSLTNLPNRRHAVRRLQEEWATAESSDSPLSLVMLDVDHFKRVNDKYGHEIGDLVLRSVADVLGRTTRRNEFACRFGGEEFLVICRGAELEETFQCAERIRKAIRNQVAARTPFDEEVTVSAGVAARTHEMRSVEDLLRAADRAVFRAKDEGRDRTCAASIAGDVPECERKRSENGGNDSSSRPARAEGDEAA